MRDGLLYEKIFEDIYSKIASGVFPPKSKLPAEKELAASYGVSHITVKKAMELLTEGGLLKRQPGSGTFVCPREEWKTEFLTAEPALSPPQNHTTPLSFKEQKVIACITEDVSDAFGVKTLRAMTRFAEKAGYRLVIQLSLNSQEREARDIEFIKNSGALGLIVFPAMSDFYNKELLRAVVDNYPVVTINRTLNGLPSYSVGIDHEQGAYELLSHFYKKGHRSIGIIGEPPEAGTGLEERYAGFSAAAREYRAEADLSFFYQWKKELPPEESSPVQSSSIRITHSEDNPSFHREAERYRHFLQEHPNITGYIGCNNGCGQLMRHVANLEGLQVPADISIACFDDVGYEYSAQSLTHIYQPEDQLSRVAIELLTQSIEQKGAACQNVILDYIFRDYGTVATI